MSNSNEDWPGSMASAIVEGQDVSAAGIIHDAAGCVLLQLREDKPGVAYPGYWGLFGGRVEAGETPEKGLKRELSEELGITLSGEAKHFSTVAWDGGGLGRHVRIRHYFLISAPNIDLDELTLGEGDDMTLAPVSDIPQKFTVMPHDHLALSMWRGNAFAKRESG